MSSVPTGISERHMTIPNLLRSCWTAAGRRALANFAGLGVCTAVSQLTMLVVLFVLTRQLGPEGFGAVVFVLNVQMYLYVVGTAGLISVVVRDLTADPAQADQTTTGFFAITTAAATLAGCMAVVVGFFMPLDHAEKILLAVVAAGNVAVALNLAPLYDARHRQALAAALGLVGDVTALAGVMTAAWLDGLTLPVVGGVLLAKWLVTLAVQVAVYHAHIRPFAWRWSRGRASAMLRSGLPLLVAGAVTMVPLNGSVLLVRLLHGERATALYGLALQVATVYLLGAALAQRILQPHVSGPHGLERAFRQKLVLFSATFLGGLWLAGVLGSWVTTKHVLDAAYQDAFGPCVVLLTAALVYSVGGIASLYLVRFGRERAVQAAHIGGAVGYAVLAAVCFARLSLVGIGLLTLAAAAIVTGVLVAQVRHTRRAPGTDD